MNTMTWTSPHPPHAYIMTETCYSAPTYIQPESTPGPWPTPPSHTHIPMVSSPKPPLSPHLENRADTRVVRNKYLDPSPPGAPETVGPHAFLTDGHIAIPLPLHSPHN